MSEYDQPEKRQARWLALCHAVESLTTHRDTSPVVTLDHFRRGMKYVCATLETTNVAGYTCFPYPHEQVKEKCETFAELHATRIGKRKANELQVLFLSGPEPMNDLEVMFKLGVRSENVWAVESDKNSFDQAVESFTQRIRDQNLPGQPEAVFGLYGFPYHCNVEKQRRWRYVAQGKITPMYLDVFVLDQARYFVTIQVGNGG